MHHHSNLPFPTGDLRVQNIIKWSLNSFPSSDLILSVYIASWGHNRRRIAIAANEFMQEMFASGAIVAQPNLATAIKLTCDGKSSWMKRKKITLSVKYLV